MLCCFQKENLCFFSELETVSNKSPMESLLHCFCLSFQNCTNISREFEMETISNFQISKVVMVFDVLSCNL